MRNALNALYQASTVLAASCLVAISSLVVLQVIGRMFDWARTVLGLEPLGLQIPSLAEFAGFLLVGASFLALAGTLRNGDHIRVSILLQAVKPPAARLLNIWVLMLALALASFFTWHAGMLAYDSFQFDETSVGIIPVPLIYPQLVMTFGLLVYSISLVDDLIVAVTGGAPSFETAVRSDPIEGSE